MNGRLILAAAALLLSACSDFDLHLPTTAKAEHEAVPISPATWAAYQSYLTVIGNTGRGAFAIAEDGAGGMSWVCTTNNCTRSADYQAKALDSCRATTNYQCVIFAIDRTPQIEFAPPQ